MAKNQAKITIHLDVLVKNAEQAAGALDKIASTLNNLSGGQGKLGGVAEKLQKISTAGKTAAGLLKKLFDSIDTKEMAGGLAKLLQQLGVLKSGAGGTAAATAALSASLTVLVPVLVVLAALLAGLAVAFVALKAAVTAFKVAITIAKAILQAWKQQLETIKASLTELKQALGRGVDGLRQFTQGLLSVGRAITFFISIPLTAFIKEAAQAAVEFEQQMARVQKVLGASAEDLEPVVDYIMQMAEVSSVGIDTLSKFAEQLAQLGVVDLDRMKEMITVFEVFSVAADISSDSIAFSMGKIAKAYGKDLNTKEASAFMLGLASTLNKLENIASVTASSLLTTMSDIGSESDILAIPPYVIATWATLAQEQNMSANEAGTAIKRLITGMVEYSDTIFETTKSLNLWASEQDYLEALNNDFVGTIETLAGGLAGLDSGVAQVGMAYEALEKRGGSALVKLLKSMEATEKGTDRYTEVLKAAQEAFRDYSSLVQEFEIMQQSTSSSLEKVKNSLNVLSITIGKDVLPAIQDFLNVIGPGIKALGETFAGLSDGTKRWILGLIAFVAVAGPAAFFINQVAFGFVMAAQGLAKMLAIVPAAIKAIFMLVRGMLTLNPAALMVGAALFGVFRLLSSSTGDVITTIVTMFRNLASQMGKWGKGIFDAFATGIESSGARIRNALLNIIKIFEAFFRSFSPPKEGPLSQIDVWGENLFNTYLRGFENADFDTLSNVASKVEGILTAFNFTPDSEGQDASRKSVISSLIGFKEDFAKLLSDFRKFGDVSESAIDKLVSGFGNAKDEIKDLIQATLRYEKLLIRIREIEQAKKDVKKQYKAQQDLITNSQMSAEEMVEALGDEQWIRDRNLSALEEEKKMLEEQAEIEKQRLDWQNSFMDALQDQADLLMELLETMKDMAGAMGGMADALSGMGGGMPADLELPSIDSFMSEMNKRVDEFRGKITKIKVFAIGAFLTIAGFAKIMWLTITGASDEEKAAALGAFDEIKGKVAEIVGIEFPEESMMDKLIPTAGNFEDLFNLGEFVSNIAGSGEEISAAFIGLFDGVKNKVAPIVTDIFNALLMGNEAPASGEFLTGWEAQLSDSGADMGGGDEHPLVKFAKFVNELGTGLATHGPTIIEHLSTIGGQIWTFVGGLLGVQDASGVNGVLENIAIFLGNIAEQGTVPEILTKVWNALVWIWTVGETVVNTIKFLWFAFSVLTNPILTVTLAGYGLVYMFSWMKLKVMEAFNAIATFLGLSTIFDGGISEMKTSLQGLLERMGEVASGATGLDFTFDDTIGSPLPIDTPITDMKTFETKLSEMTGAANIGLTNLGTDFATLNKMASEELLESTGSVETFRVEVEDEFAYALEAVSKFTGAFSSIPEKLEHVAGILAGMTIPAPEFETVREPWWVKFVKGGVFVMPAGVPHAQAGGFRSGPGPTLVGEGGPEILSLPPGGHVTSHGLSSLILNDFNAAAEGGGDTVNININNPVVRQDSDIDRLAEAVASVIAKRTRTRGRFGG